MARIHAFGLRCAARLPAGVLAIVCAAAAACAQTPQDAAKDETPVDFLADIQPILTAHCVKCHGPQRQSSGLRLDAREFAMRGGDSGRDVLGGTLETNELAARVSSSDRTYRMPKNAPPLSSAQIELVRRWVAQGTPWPAPRASAPSQRFYERWLEAAGAFVDRYEAEYRYVQPYTIGFLVLQCGLLVVMRVRAAYRKGKTWTTGRFAWFCKFCDGVTNREVLLAMLLSAGALALVWARGHTLAIERQLARFESERGQVQSPFMGSVFGWPPKPVRPDHPKQVAGTYYRGNCERNAELFNGGNYLTATFHVRLCDQERKQLDVGGPLPEGGVCVYVEIERAPGTTDQLFSKDLMNSVLLVKNFYEAPNTQLKEQPVRLETLEPGMRWSACVPIGSPGGDGRLDGVIYIYTGQINDNKLLGSLHYGVEYALAFTGGKLSPESDLWMDSFGNPTFEPPRPPGKLPYREWFDYRPIPVITGKNTSDPKLLGVEEYVKKGLIKPQPTKAPEASGPSGDGPKGAQTGEPPDDE
jgi:mono/diheme cytochrome c family protein